MDIAEIVSNWTGIPLSKLQQTERNKLLHLSDELHKRVIGQVTRSPLATERSTSV